MKISKIIAILLVALLSAGAGSAVKIQDFIKPEASNIKENIEYDETSGSINLMIVGIDDVEGVHRSDTIAFATIDIDRKIIRFMSIPRDTRVQIPGHGWQKINHAYAYGKEKLLQRTLVNYLGMPINYYAVVNYNSFPEIVDLLGGVDINVEKSLYYNDSAGNLHINIQKGQQHLDGQDALGYVRFRNDALGDIGRVKRQQKFLKALINKTRDPEIVGRIPKLTKELLNLVESNLSPGQAIQLASYLKDIPRTNMAYFTLPGKAAYISNISYWIGDLSKASTFLSALPQTLKDRGLPDSSSTDVDVNEKSAELKFLDSIKTPVAVLNGDGTPGLGKKVADQLQRLGVDVAFIGNAKHFDYRYSSIRFPDNLEEANKGSQVTAKALAEICDIPEKLVKREETAPYATIIVGHNFYDILEKLEKLNNDM